AIQERACLVCAGTTTVAHLGLDICRACTVFYRRSRNREFACRSTTNNCPIGEGVNCRKCRMAELERMLSERPNKLQSIKEEALTAPGTPVEHTDCETDESEISSIMHHYSTSAKCYCEHKSQESRELLERLRETYRVMCETRLAGEMAARKPPTSPLAVVKGDYKIIPSTLGGLEIADRIYLTALLHFGAAAFPEFSSFQDTDQVR
ncbi:hypothetical protein PENTCL1PPCAC_29023, partial [Pristionchus entomophagus]